MRESYCSNRGGVILGCLTRRQEVWLIVVLALAVRLVAVNAPYTSVHWIKQLQIAPIAQNLYEDGYNILWPETDYSADQRGYIEIEFQLVTFLTALLYPIFGMHEWVGRAVTIAFSLGSMVLLYALLRRYLGDRPAVFGLLFFAFAPSNWYFSRVLMSEPLMIFFSVALVYYFSLWLGVPGGQVSRNPGRYLVLAVLCGALAFLVKLPTLMLVFPLVFIAHQRYGWGLFKQPLLYLFALLTVLPAVAYYYHARVNIGAHYFTVGVGFGGGMWGSVEHFLRPGNYSLMLNRLLKDHLTAVGIVLLPLGFLAYGNGRFRWNLFHVWLGAVLLYFVAVSGGNLRQTYYQLPLLIPAAGLIGIGWDRVSRMAGLSRLAVPTLVAVFLTLAAWGVQPFYEEHEPIIEAAAQLDVLDASKQQRVIIFPPGYGCLYYFERPGWVGREGFGKPASEVAAHDVPGPQYVENRIKRGARWAVYFDATGPGARPDLQQYLAQNYRVALAGGGYTIYDLAPPR